MLRPVPVPDLGWSRTWAFDGATGAGVDVAVVDSGIDASHPDVGHVSSGLALSWDRDNGGVLAVEGPHDDLFGHGTACAGIIRRAAPDCRLHSVRVLGTRLSGKGIVFAEGVRRAVRSGARVVNLSLSTSNADLQGLFHDVADEAYFAGVTLVCAINNVRSPSYPSQYSAVVSVAANDGSDPFDLDCNPDPPVEFGAPGIDVAVPWLGGAMIVTTGNSFAAPHVTGLVADRSGVHAARERAGRDRRAARGAEGAHRLALRHPTSTGAGGAGPRGHPFRPAPGCRSGARLSRPCGGR